MNDKTPTLEERFETLISAEFPNYVTQHRFHPIRKWRADFAWTEPKIIVEIEGGLYVRGRHQTALGFAADIEKYNECAILGWLVLRFCTADFKDTDKILDTVRRAFAARRSHPVADAPNLP